MKDLKPNLKKLFEKFREEKTFTVFYSDIYDPNIFCAYRKDENKKYLIDLVKDIFQSKNKSELNYGEIYKLIQIELKKKNLHLFVSKFIFFNWIKEHFVEKDKNIKNIEIDQKEKNLSE
jgi:hypothetical protein